MLVILSEYSIGHNMNSFSVESESATRKTELANGSQSSGTEKCIWNVSHWYPASALRLALRQGGTEVYIYQAPVVTHILVIRGMSFDEHWIRSHQIFLILQNKCKPIQWYALVNDICVSLYFLIGLSISSFPTQPSFL